MIKLKLAPESLTVTTFDVVTSDLSSQAQSDTPWSTFATTEVYFLRRGLHRQQRLSRRKVP